MLVEPGVSVFAFRWNRRKETLLPVGIGVCLFVAAGLVVARPDDALTLRGSGQEGVATDGVCCVRGMTLLVDMRWPDEEPGRQKSKSAGTKARPLQKARATEAKATLLM